MPPRMMEETKRDQEVFVESQDMVGMFTCFALCGAAAG